MCIRCPPALVDWRYVGFPVGVSGPRKIFESPISLAVNVLRGPAACIGAASDAPKLLHVSALNCQQRSAFLHVRPQPVEFEEDLGFVNTKTP